MLQIVGLIFILALIYAVKAIAIAKQSGELAQMSASFSWMHARKQDAEMAEAWTVEEPAKAPERVTRGTLRPAGA